ncbi:ABC-type sugar transport system, permease component [Caldisphaera lagunensis DSM 15908]|uniref:ABC-type sugar transport system, permease component n=1 Tax=Caldisphaera lagunensis (strain DSM 15908 / JCM 11604 / ANMR 0165 / IC-154) TaxID=1056495 RepID=L0A9V7_CALLD|nr:glucose ABC transporter permease GlcU [Caldisphaera lagunensis]AFZ70678.1 ABC-type sugar transport system, permease component [Caldisphaera lagunensis DSM 15908]
MGSEIGDKKYKSENYYFRVIKYAILQLVAAALVILWLIPLYALFIGGLKSNIAAASTPALLPPSKPSGEAFYFVWHGFGGIYGLIGLEYPLIREALIALPVAALATLLGTMGAYFFYIIMDRHYILSTIGFAIISLATYLPIETTTVPLIQIVSSLHIYNTYYGVIFAYFMFYTPMAALLMSIFMPSIPKYLLEAAKIDGSNDWIVFWKVMMPLLVPGFLSTFIFTFLEIWNNFFIPILLVSNPNLMLLSIGVRQYAGGYAIIYNRSFAAGVIGSIVPLVIFILLGRYFIRGLAALGGGAKGI